MGWTSYYISSYSNGFNRKKELDSELWRNESNHELIKSVMVGSTYYAAVKFVPTGKIYGLVCLTSIKDHEFFYKEISEDMGPAETKCPMSIINLLSETDNEFALEWRNRCINFHNQEKMYTSHRDLKGILKYSMKGQIEYKKGDEVHLYWVQRGRAKYYTDGYNRWQKRYIMDLENLSYL